MAYERSIPRPLVERNIDLSKRRPIRNPDGTFSLVRSMSIEEPRGAVLIPTISRGKVLPPHQAVREYRRTGKHLGIFLTSREADEYSKRLSRSLGIGDVVRRMKSRR